MKLCKIKKNVCAAIVICFWISNCKSTGINGCCDGMSAKSYTEGHETDVAIQEPEGEVTVYKIIWILTLRNL